MSKNSNMERLLQYAKLRYGLTRQLNYPLISEFPRMPREFLTICSMGFRPGRATREDSLSHYKNKLRQTYLKNDFFYFYAQGIRTCINWEEAPDPSYFSRLYFALIEEAESRA